MKFQFSLLSVMKFALALAASLYMPCLSFGSITTVSNPGGTSEIGSRIRWGATGFEASIFDSDPFAQTPTLNPGGAPVWGVGNSGYGFAISFDPATGNLSLSVDFNRDNSFGAGESISRSAFGGATTSYVGQGFQYLSISGNESGSTGRSTVSNLVINGDSQSSIVPNGGFSEVFYKDSTDALLGPLTITGNLSFQAAGTSQERPSWNFTLKNASAIVPEASTIAVWSVLSVIGAGIAYRKRSAK